MAILLMSKTTDETCIEQEYLKVVGDFQSLAYIPSKTDPTRKYFSLVKNHFVGLGVREVRCCDLDNEFNSKTLDLIKSADAIYMAGGFTPYFLRVLQLRGAVPLIREFSQKKPVIGVSAGALILGQSISILFDDPDEGSEARALSNSEGVGLYDFEFWPHFGRFEHDESRLRKRSLTNQDSPIIGCDDAAGLIVSEDGVRVVGSAHVFVRGAYEVYQDQVLASSIFNARSNSAN